MQVTIALASKDVVKRSFKMNTKPLPKACTWGAISWSHLYYWGISFSCKLHNALLTVA